MKNGMKDTIGCATFALFAVLLFLGILYYIGSTTYVVYKVYGGDIVKITDPDGREVKAVPEGARCEIVWVDPDQKRR